MPPNQSVGGLPGSESILRSLVGMSDDVEEEDAGAGEEELLREEGEEGEEGRCSGVQDEDELPPSLPPLLVKLITEDKGDECCC